VCEFARIAATSGMPKLVSIQNSYSLLTRGAFETDLAEVCSPSNANVGLLAYSPLAGGALTGKYLGESPPEGARFTMFPGYMERFNKSATREATAEYARVAGEYGLSPAALALAFVRSRWFVTSTIIGATSMEQLGENIDAFNVEMTQECLDDIDAVYKKYKDPAMS
jgi:aryl-alcohol dehydrogenase-like predicted oxidoreductase